MDEDGTTGAAAPALRVGSRTLEYRFTLRSLRLLSERLGVKIRPAYAAEDLLDTPVPLEAVGVALWACLQHHDPAPTLAEVEDAVDHRNMREVLRDFFGLFGVTWSDAAQQMLTGSSDAPPAEAETPDA